MSNNVTPVNVQLTADLLQELETVQDWHGLKSRAEAVRFLIRHEARRIATRQNVTMVVPRDD